VKLNLSDDKTAARQVSKEEGMNGEQVGKQMIGAWKASWETYLKTIKAAEEQGDRMLDLMLQQSDTLQGEAKKMVRQWVENAKEISKTYLGAIEQNVKRIDDILEPKSE
jgi:hypothetical protein